MRIKNRFILSYFLSGLIPLLLLCFFGVYSLCKTKLDGVFQFYNAQLYQVNNNISTLISSVEHDVENLSNNKTVTTRDDRNFTSFLDADENNFVYNFSPAEQAIIDIFNTYRKTHPYANSIYMGRENGSFVRSHPRPRPTKYDPRERPWYKLAEGNPGRVVRTEPYFSITSQDINIGIVKALLDGEKNIYGVIGIDITLDKMSNFIEGVKVLKGSYIMLIDEKGMILTNPDSSKIFHPFEELNINNSGDIFKNKEGYLQFNSGNEGFYLYYYTSPEFGWKICAMVPGGTILQEASNIMLLAVLFIIISIGISFCVSVVIERRIIGSFNRLLKGMHTLADRIKSRAAFEKIHSDSRDEVQELVDTFNEMARELAEAYVKLDDHYKRIKELDWLKSAFVSMVSHELRTPLAIIKGSAVLLMDTEDRQLSKKQKELVEMIRNNAIKFQTMIEDLLDISKIESGIFLIKKSKCDIVEIIEKAIDENSPAANSKNVKIIKKYPDSRIEWAADYLRIKRVFDSLLNNAVKFSPDNSEIIIEVKKMKGKEVKRPAYIKSDISPDGQYLLVSITDNGPGVQEQYTEKIFEKFFQVESVLARKHQGAGIGLSIAKSFVDAHGGIIWIHSQGIDKGSTFYVLLPE